jgi:hypothetical protein
VAAGCATLGNQPQVRTSPVAFGATADDDPGLGENLHMMGDEIHRQAQRLADLARRGDHDDERVHDGQPCGLTQCRTDPSSMDPRSLSVH